MNSYLDQIKNRINDFDSRKVFINNDFLDIAGNETVRRTLNQLVSENKIKRVINGFYYNPIYSELIGEYEAVSIHELALAIARKYNWNIAPFNSTALNLLGLSTQVPTHYKYISSGRYKEYKIGDTVLEFKKVNPGEIANMSLKTATIIQAIKSLGKENITSEVMQKIRENLTEKERIDLMNESKSVPAWIYEVIREICEGQNE
ncbi:TPA: DUF6088 family protein [Streptococcus agalactiae]|uniref:Type IV toxin-antitoxin system AbiEi family antitoxin domain-containing protein n=4 Tax=Bacillota TaxID=1239 RepID=A0A6N2ZMF9_FINMA|nr:MULTISPECIES: DUF6088 family protein [Bacillota]MDU4046878.1 DUF6088 family protein [Peptoniphilus harei]HEP6947915.1 hypothetical protein [Streptococcus pyogenes]AIF86834.1 hypothetical protein EN72_07055 [Streptococcus agalactiae]EMA8746460.1 hypothetical protein [Streptococcus agalactiae]EMA8747374.1 hypothetical protein [Streptococcus agalactiae]